jgi:hypothetical protein
MIKISKLEKNNIFYYAGKVYICGWVTNNNGDISAMETHKEGKHRYFKPDTEVVFISPSFMKKLLRPQSSKEMVSTSYNSRSPKQRKSAKD